MLTRLMISNYALISHVEIDFDDGLTIITGETGAGKSIMMGALSLLLGGRADSRVVRDTAAKSVVEASFTPTPGLRQLFETNALDWDDDEVIIRREISASGRSRAFINDTPVNLKVLSEATSGLIDIHSQNSNLMLRDQRRQLEIIDSLADNSRELGDYREAFRRFVKLRNELREARNEVSRNRENEEFIRFQLAQLDKLRPRAGELAELERQSEILGDAEDIKERLAQALTLIDESESGAVAQLTEARHLLSRVNFSLLESDNEASDPGIAQRLESVYVELKDISATLEGTLETIDNNPVMLAKIEKRLTDLYEALKRFNASDDAALAEIHLDLKRQLATLGTSDTDIEEMEHRLKEQGKVLKEAADRLSLTRTAAAEKFSTLLVDTARPLGMSNLKFSAMLSKGKFSADGQDNIAFLCAFNKNQDLMPVADVASGGETSRLMLSIKGIIARHVSLPSIIFDEVDTGVSGEVADRMGGMMRELGHRIQVIAITHLPQVAAKGMNHYKVYKADDEDKTVTHISLLDKEKRVEEIALMLSGSAVDKAALANARSLLAQNR